MEGLTISPILVFLVLLVLYVLSTIQILNEYERPCKLLLVLNEPRFALC